VVCLSLLQYRSEALFGHATGTIDEIHDGKRCCMYVLDIPWIAADTEQLIDLLRKEDGDDNGLLSRLLLCRFLATSALVVLARSEDNIERAVSI
jgi:hypothetical protein